VDGLSRRNEAAIVDRAGAGLHDPKVLLLDEPAGNLDPRRASRCRELLQGTSADAQDILISSHILPEWPTL